MRAAEARIIARPPDVDRADTVEWKAGELERLLTDVPGTVVVIDDNLALGLHLAERNRHGTWPIVSIVFLGQRSSLGWCFVAAGASFLRGGLERYHPDREVIRAHRSWRCSPGASLAW